jgi:hypothetical protein
MEEGWIGVDLDGTLAVYEGWKGEEHIGEPVPLMLQRVKTWVAEGRRVKIFTARAYGREHVVPIVHDWLVQHGLPPLEVTCVKDYACLEIWDDRAVHVQQNTGRVLG